MIGLNCPLQTLSIRVLSSNPAMLALVTRSTSGIKRKSFVPGMATTSIRTRKLVVRIGPLKAIDPIRPAGLSNESESGALRRLGENPYCEKAKFAAFRIAVGFELGTVMDPGPPDFLTGVVRHPPRRLTRVAARKTWVRARIFRTRFEGRGRPRASGIRGE